MSDLQLSGLLDKLQRLKLIERFSCNRIRLLTARTIAWRKAGPVRELYEQQIKAEFLQGDFEAAGGLLRFETAELSESSINIVSRKIERLVKEFDDLAELDMALSPEKNKVSACCWRSAPGCSRCWLVECLHNNLHSAGNGTISCRLANRMPGQAARRKPSGTMPRTPP